MNINDFTLYLARSHNDTKMTETSNLHVLKLFKGANGINFNVFVFFQFSLECFYTQASNADATFCNCGYN